MFKTMETRLTLDTISTIVIRTIILGILSTTTADISSALNIQWMFC